MPIGIDAAHLNFQYGEESMSNISLQAEPDTTPLLDFENQQRKQNLPLGVLGGLLGGILGAVLWAAISYFTNYQIGWMAVAVGFLVGFGVSRLGHGIDLRFAIAGAIIAFISVVMGNFLVAIGLLAKYWDVSYFEALQVFNYAMTLQLLIETFSPIDILFYALAIVAGFRFSRPAVQRVNQKPAEPASHPASVPMERGQTNAFNGRLLSALSPDRLYRVFFTPGEVFFIQIGGQSIGPIIAAQFGFLGQSIYLPIQEKARAKLEAKVRELDAQPPSAHLAASKHNFSAVISDIEKSTLQAAATFGQHGPHFGRWVLQLRGRKPMTLQLETADDMQRALETLPLAIGIHENQVAWDATKGKFTKTT